MPPRRGLNPSRNRKSLGYACTAAEMRFWEEVWPPRGSRCAIARSATTLPRAEANIRYGAARPDFPPTAASATEPSQAVWCGGPRQARLPSLLASSHADLMLFVE